MNPESSDRLLRDLFRRLRERDETSMPPLAHLLGRAPQPKHVTRRRSIVLGLAAAAACAALVLIALLPHGRSPSEEEFSKLLQSAEPITAWEEPTELLLEPPEPGLLRGIPVVGDTSVNINIQ
jgi:type VI protein secretion system component VasF